MIGIIYGGPTLYGADPSLLEGFELRPPAGGGDIVIATRRGVRTILLVDGFYGDRCAPFHKEILYALSQGVSVYGAASMGALRASECWPFGMVGYGKTFEEYRDGVRFRDSDVAVLHAPAELEYRPLTLPQVDVEATLEALTDTIGETSRRLLFSASQSLHFSVRTAEAIAKRAGPLAGDPVVLSKLIKVHKVQRKKKEALGLIKFCKNISNMRSQPKKLQYYHFNHTSFIDQFGY